MRDRIVARYDQHVLRRSALSIGDGEAVFRDILGDGRFYHALEIGTYRGVSAAVMAQFCDKVTTIDLHHGRREQLGETWDRAAFWKAMGRDNIDLVLVHNDAEKAARVRAIDFDFAFIDGAHDTRTVRLDFSLVKRCGTVLFHDYDRSGGSAGRQVAEFVDTLPKQQVQVIGLFALWTAPPSG